MDTTKHVEPYISSRKNKHSGRIVLNGNEKIGRVQKGVVIFNCQAEEPHLRL